MNFKLASTIRLLLLGLFLICFDRGKILAEENGSRTNSTDFIENEKLQNIREDSSNFTVDIKKINFIGNTVFSQKELTKVAQKYIEDKNTFENLLEVEKAITKLYVEAGYINSAAVIPTGQTIKDREVTIQIIEGSIAEIKVIGNERLNTNYIRDRIAQGTKKPFNINQLLESLRLLQLDSLIEQISVELSPGIIREASILQVTVTEADSFQLTAIADNGRSPSVGSFRRGLGLTEANLFGLGDRFDFNWTNTDGSNSLNTGYEIPINASNGKILLSAGYRDTEVIEEPFDRIDINGDSVYYELGLRQPISQSSRQELALGLKFSYQTSQTELSGENFPLSRGANEDGETTISALRFFQEWTNRNNNEVFALRSQFNFGLGILGATDNRELPDSSFFSWNGQGQYVRSLSKNTLLVFSGDLQIATEELVPLEKFGLGGLYSVRGYRQDFLLTDNAVFTSAEIQLPIFNVEKVEGILQIIPFIDFGIGWNSGEISDRDPNHLLGVGLGLQWRMKNKFSARLDWGIPLVDADIQERTLQEQGLYFSVDYNL